MPKLPKVTIKRGHRGYYSLFINEEFVGNFDTASEAGREADYILDTMYEEEDDE